MSCHSYSQSIKRLTRRTNTTVTADTAGDTTVITTTTVDMFLDDEDEDDEDGVVFEVPESGVSGLSIPPPSVTGSRWTADANGEASPLPVASTPAMEPEPELELEPVPEPEPQPQPEPEPELEPVPDPQPEPEAELEPPAHRPEESRLDDDSPLDRPIGAERSFTDLGVAMETEGYSDDSFDESLDGSFDARLEDVTAALKATEAQEEKQRLKKTTLVAFKEGPDEVRLYEPDAPEEVDTLELLLSGSFGAQQRSEDHDEQTEHDDDDEVILEFGDDAANPDGGVGGEARSLPPQMQVGALDVHAAQSFTVPELRALRTGAVGHGPASQTTAAPGADDANSAEAPLIRSRESTRQAVGSSAGPVEEAVIAASAKEIAELKEKNCKLEAEAEALLGMKFEFETMKEEMKMREANEQRAKEEAASAADEARSWREKHEQLLRLQMEEEQPKEQKQEGDEYASDDSDLLEDSEEAKWEAQAALERQQREAARAIKAAAGGEGEDSVDWDKELAGLRDAIAGQDGATKESYSDTSRSVDGDDSLDVTAPGTDASAGPDVSADSSAMQLAAAALAKLEAEAQAQEAREDVATLQAELAEAQAAVAKQVDEAVAAARAEMQAAAVASERLIAELKAEVEEERAQSEAASDMVAWKQDQLDEAERQLEEALAEVDEARQKAKEKSVPSATPAELPPAEQGDARVMTMRSMLSLATELLMRKRTTVRLLRAA